MVDERWLIQRLVLDAAPLIYLAKLEALDVLSVVSALVCVPPAVVEETTRPALSLRHPDAVSIEVAIREKAVTVIELTASEADAATGIAGQIPGLHAGECQVLAIARERGMAAVIFERRARRVAHTLGVELVDVLELLALGTTDAALLEDRFRRFGRLVELRLPALERLIEGTRKRQGR